MLGLIDPCASASKTRNPWSIPLFLFLASAQFFARLSQKAALFETAHRQRTEYLTQIDLRHLGIDPGGNLLHELPRIGIGRHVEGRHDRENFVRGFSVLRLGKTKRFTQDFDNICLGARIMDEYDRIDQPLEQARDLIGRAGGGFLEKANGRALIREAQLADVGEHVRTRSLGGFTVTVRDHRSIDAARVQRLRYGGGIAENAHFEIVFLWIDAELIQSDHRLQPKPAADALHAEGLTAKILDGANFFTGY